MNNFKYAFERTLKNEGDVLTNDPKDPGGLTKFGISKRAFPHEDIRSLTLERAQDLYYRYYWLPMKCHTINDMFVAAKCFDLAVNTGVRQATKIVQRAAEVKEDGVMGNTTISAVNSLPPKEFLDKLIKTASIFYIKLVEAKPELGKYLTGWLNRCKL